MSNVVSLSARRPNAPRREAVVAKRDNAALVSDLVAIVAGLKAVSGRTSSLPLQRRALEVEQTIQLLLDAMAPVERETDALAESGEFAPL